MRPSSIFFGRNGSAIEGRAAPMKSSTPRLICDTIVSGEVKRPTPTTGLVVSCFTKLVYSSWKPSFAKRDVWLSFGQLEMLTSHRSGSSASISMTSRASPSCVRPAIADQLIGGETYSHGALIADCLLRVLDQLAQQPRAVLQASAIFVDAVVLAPLQELVRDRQVVRRVDIDNVEPRFLRAERGIAMPLAKVADVLFVHRAGLDRIIINDRAVRRGHRREPRSPVRDRSAVVHDLDGGKRAMFVHDVGHQGHRRDVTVIPKAPFVERLTVGTWMDLSLFGRDDRPAAFSLDSAQPCERLGLGPADARAVRHLVEAVAGGHRADPDRLEQDVVALLAAHAGTTASIVSPSSETIVSSSWSVTLYGGASRM